MTPSISAALPDVDFRRIRPYGSPASRVDAFEELPSILIRDGLLDWPAGTVFHRFGNPDGGRERKVRVDLPVDARASCRMVRYGPGGRSTCSSSVTARSDRSTSRSSGLLPPIRL